MTLTEYLVRRGPLFAYAPVPEIYRCPADKGWIEVNGKPYRRAVSYGLSIYLNGGSVRQTAREWLGHDAVARESQISQPSSTLAFVGEDPEGNGGTQFVYYPPGDDRWISFPADHHGMACNLSFADGHVEGWRWTAVKSGRWKLGMPIPVQDEADREDLHRVQQTVPCGGSVCHQ
jgi:prepilin-type processing-associated H-X9-DG protein